ncbi:MAG: class I SAM-dependent methyltransferase [Aliidongia sp.]
MTTTACAICSGNGMHLRYPEAIDYLTGDRFEVWTCTVCGSGRTEPVPGNLHRHYPPRYRQYHLAIKWILQLLYHHRVKRWARLFSRPGTAFEMGCGDAMMLASLSRLGWQVLGSERTEESAAAARMKSGLPIVVGGPEAIDPTARFDLIVLNQVLEHLDAPGAVITQLAGMLAPGGKLVIDVPNFASWQSLFGGTGWFHLDVPRHLHHFTRPSLTLLLRRHGLKVTAVSYVSPEHDVFGWVQSILKSARSPDQQVDSAAHAHRPASAS